MTKAERKYCMKSLNWFKDAKRNHGVNQLYIWNDMLGFGVMFNWPVDTEKMHDILKLYLCEMPGSVLHYRGAKHVCDTETDRHFVFFSKGSIAEPVRAKNIAHECLHVVCAAQRYRNIPLTSDGEETYAYLLGWLVGEVSTRLEQ